MENVYLENKKVSVKIVDKQRSGFSKDSIGRTMYPGCKQVYQCPTNEYDRLVPILTEPEQRWFEDQMGLDKGSLAFNNKEKSFWKDFKVTLDKKGRTFDLNNLEDNLAYRVLKISNSIAKTKDSINELQHSFYMTSDEEEKEVDSKLADRYEEASKLFINNIAKSDKKMINVLRLLGKRVPVDSNTKWLKSEMVKIIEQKAKIPGVSNMDDFISIASDPAFELKVFIMDAMEIGEVTVEGTTYKLRSGDVIGYDYAQAISYFTNPKNQQSKFLIEDRIKNNRKDGK
jgi:hypothetical protein